MTNKRVFSFTFTMRVTYHVLLALIGLTGISIAIPVDYKRNVAAPVTAVAPQPGDEFKRDTGAPEAATDPDPGSEY